MAYTKPIAGRGADGRELKRQLGEWVRDRREEAGLTQQQLSQAVGHTYYTSVSAIETGRNVIPPERLFDYAEALKIDPRELGRVYLAHVNPWLFAMLFADDVKTEFERINDEITTRMGHDPSTARRMLNR